MAIWILLTLMTAAAVIAVLWPLSRCVEDEDATDPSAQFYRDQIAEIERDSERGLLAKPEAEAAKAEAGRRLLRAAVLSDPATGAVGEPALRRRRAASALALSFIPLVALAVYGAYGSPHLPGEPQASRLQASSGELDLATALSRIEAHLGANPQDGRGWEVVAPFYLRIGRAEDAIKAYEVALRLLGRDATRLAGHGEALVAAAGGMVPAQARAVFEEALTLDSSLHKARFYLARAAEQDGNPAKARADYAAIVASSASDAPWVPAVKDEIARLERTLASGASAAPSLASADRDAIKGMVRGLAERLEAKGGSPEEWTRLLRSYVVLGEPEKAKATLGKARQALAADQGAVLRVDILARDLNIADDLKP